MKINIIFLKQRFVVDVNPTDTILHLKQQIKVFLRQAVDVISPNSLKKSMFVLFCNGSVLHDDIVISDIGLVSGSSLKCQYIETQKSKLHIIVKFSSAVVELRDEINMETLTIGELRDILQNKLGIPVSMFRLRHPDKKRELFDPHNMTFYAIKEGDTLNLEVWHHTKMFLLAAFRHDISQTIRNLPSYHDNPSLNRYLLRVALFIAAHMDDTKLATQVLQRGIRYMFIGS